MKEELNITTVRLSEKAFEIKKELALVFGLKNILSAGLLLFGRLSSDQQKRIIAEANGIEVKPESVPPSEAEVYANLDRLVQDVASIKAQIRHRKAGKSKTHRPRRAGE